MSPATNAHSTVRANAIYFGTFATYGAISFHIISANENHKIQNGVVYCNLIALGFTLKDVQEWLGHADIKLTANVYSHLDVARKTGIAAALNDSLNPQKDAC